jgi:hypothetical protein
MNIRAFALLMGVVFGLVGVAGFVPGMTHPIHADAPPLVVDSGYGLIFGLFPVNILHNIVHLLFGALGVAAYAGAFGAVAYARLVAVSYALLTVMGLIPVLNTTFGLVPLFGADVGLHAVIAAISAYFGFVARAPDAIRQAG